MDIRDVEQIRKAAVATKRNMKRSKLERKAISTKGLINFSQQTIELCDIILEVHKLVK